MIDEIAATQQVALDTQKRIDAIRAAQAASKLDAVVIPTQLSADSIVKPDFTEGTP